MVAEVRPEVPALNDVVFLGTPDWDRLREGADDTGEEDLVDSKGGCNSL